MKSVLPTRSSGLKHNARVGLTLTLMVCALLPAWRLQGQGSISALGQLTDVAAGGGLYNYTLTMHNGAGSTSPIGSFWYAWIPGQFYLPTAPSNLQAPNGWTAGVVTLGGASSIQYIASTSASYIQPGSALTFGFSSTDTPAVLAGNAPNFPGTPIGTTVVYAAGLFSLPSETMVVTSVPEPGASALFLSGVAGLLLFSRANRRRTSS